MTVCKLGLTSTLTLIKFMLASMVDWNLCFLMPVKFHSCLDSMRNHNVVDFWILQNSLSSSLETNLTILIPSNFLQKLPKYCNFYEKMRGGSSSESMFDSTRSTSCLTIWVSSLLRHSVSASISGKFLERLPLTQTFTFPPLSTQICYYYTLKYPAWW